MANSYDLTARGEADDLDAWLRLHAVIMLIAGALATGTRTGAWVAATAAGSFAVLWLLHGTGSLANRITAARLVCVLIVAAALDRLPHAWVAALLLINIVADVLDGYVARRRRETTPFGTVLDRETDALFVLVVYLYFVVSFELEVWVVSLGLLPYAYRLASAWLLPVPPDHKERAAAWLAGLNFTLLLAALLAPRHAQDLLLVSAFVIVASFSLSFWTLLRHARSLPQ